MGGNRHPDSRKIRLREPEMPQPIRLALVGTGGRGQIYADVLKRMPPGRAEWTVLCDRNPHVLETFRDQNGLDLPTVNDVDELCARDDVDAALICTPDQAHREPAEACLNAGLHALVEKPLAT